MAEVFARTEREHAPTQLDVGHMQVLEALTALSDDWSVYDRPLVGLDQPDFVAAHPRFGVCAIVLRDWTRGHYRQSPTGRLEQFHGGDWYATDEAPRFEAHRVRNALFEQFFADSSADKLDLTVVRGIVILPQFTTADACALLRRPQMVDSENWIKVWGGRAVADDPVCVVSGHPRPQVRNVSPVGLDRLRDHCARHSVAA